MEYKFINPYNFVPLGEEKNKADKSEKRNLKGVIEYSLLTKTPLFIPNTSNDHAIFPEEVKGKSEDDDYHKSYEFFAYEDLSNNNKRKEPEDLIVPVIPGSEIRGMLRNYYEILSNSCMSAIDDDVLLSRRNPHVFKAGLIHKCNDGYKLVKDVDDCLLRTEGENNLEIICDKFKDEYAANKSYKQESLLEGQKLYVKVRPRSAAKFYGKKRPVDKNKKKINGKTVVIEISNNKIDNSYEGYLIKGEDGPVMERDGVTMKQQKHCAHVFVINKVFNEKDVDISVLDNILEIYKNNGDSTYKEYANEWKKFKKSNGNDYFPVYYSIVGECILLSPASITREMYVTKLSKMIGTYRSCGDIDNLCPACSLFGMLNTNKGIAVASRIRVSDLQAVYNCETKDLYDDYITIKELSSPKLSNVEFYLKRPENAWFWTFDYYTDENGRTIPYNASINGRKFYWHNLDVKKQDYDVNNLDDNASDDNHSDGKTERNCTIRPLKRDKKFMGKIYFDGISKRELNELIYLVNTGDTSDIESKKYGYKIGKGKPYGLGSVAMSVDKVMVRDVAFDNETINYNESEYIENNAQWDREAEENFKLLTSFSALEKKNSEGYEVSYPKTHRNSDELFKWFVSNHRAYKEKDGKKISNKSPNDRKQLYFDEYMEPLNPILKSTNIDCKISKDKNNHRRNNNENKNRRQNGKTVGGDINYI